MAEINEKTVGVEPTLSAVVVDKNEADFFLIPCIKKLLKFCDEIIYVDTGSTDNSINILSSFKDDRIRIFNQNINNPTDFTTIRNYGISKCKMDWILHLEADEVIGDNYGIIKEGIKSNPECDCFSLPSEHLMYHFGFRDATYNPHMHLKRLHKNAPYLRYPENTMHGLVEGYKLHMIVKSKPIIYHFGYCRGVAQDLKRYKENKKYKEVHTTEYLKWWKNSHFFGTYPVQSMKVEELPLEIKEHFLFDGYEEEK